jgi:mannose-6-phosphate isomerase-like protein (cupin superfamily)
MHTINSSAIVVPAGSGTEWNVLGTRMKCKISSEDTGGAYSIVESVIPPLMGPPPHIHRNEDEIFYIVDGKFEILCGDESFTATTGDLAVLPRNLPHSFRNIGKTEGRVLTTISPGGLESFFAEVSQEIKTLPPDIQKLERIGRKYDVELLL